MSMPITTTNTYNFTGTTIMYCRPYQGVVNYYEYYVNSNSLSVFELGTFEHPFKNMDSPAKEIFNFMYSPLTNYTVYHMRGTNLTMYYAIMPIILLNLEMYTLTTYGNESLPKPYVTITDTEYLWPAST
jgi:hypothetical protein